MRWLPSRFALLLACVAWGCGPEAQVRQARPMPFVAKPARAPADAGGLPGRALDVRDELSVVSRERGLATLRPVTARSVSAAEFRRLISELVERRSSAGRVWAFERLLRLFGVVEPTFDYRRAVIALFDDNAEAVYDPDRGALFVRTDLDLLRRRAAILHELVHALQDQHFGLGALSSSELDTDRKSALLAVCEGDALWTTQALLGEASGDSAPSSAPAPLSGRGARTPNVLVESFRAPYVAGFEFVRRLIERGEASERDRAFLAPSLSTEQVLHWDKWVKREPAVDVPVPLAPPVRVELVHADTVGEQALALLLLELGGTSDNLAKAGWGGDRLAVYRAGDDAFVGWVIRFDDQEAAKRASSALPGGRAACARASGVGRTTWLVSDSTLIWAGVAGAGTSCALLLDWARSLADSR